MARGFLSTINRLLEYEQGYLWNNNLNWNIKYGTSIVTNLFRHLYLLLWQSDYSSLINIFCDKIYYSLYMKVFIDFDVWWSKISSRIYIFVTKYISSPMYDFWRQNFITLTSYCDEIISSSMINMCDKFIRQLKLYIQYWITIWWQKWQFLVIKCCFIGDKKFRQLCILLWWN